MRRPRKLATLTPKESKAWDFAYAMYADPMDARKDKQAAEMAWRDMQKDFPRLRAFDGCRP